MTTEKDKNRIKTWKERNPDKVKGYYLKNKEKYRLRNKQRYENNKDILRNQTYLKKYGLTLEQYNEMAKAQNYYCAICGQPEKLKKRLAVDHDHITGRVRKLLCHRCNVAIGGFEDDFILLQKAVDYLKESS